MGMNPEIKAKWLEDLRSGNFRKGTNKLHKIRKDADGNEVHEFCCLGVLCEQAVAAGIVERRKVDGFPRTYRYFDPNRPTDASEVYPPAIVQEWAGLTSDNPKVDLDPEVEKDVEIRRQEESPRVSLATLNDDYFDTFEPIASKIEQL